MSRFYVGCRVRVISSAYPELIGELGVITSASEWNDADWRVQLDRDADGKTWLAFNRNIEPVEGDDSRQLTTWDSIEAIGWKPPLRVGA